MKLYTSIKRHNNYGRYDRFVNGEDIVIQEKIDGSNVSFMNDNGVLRIFSRRNELNLLASDFKGFEAYMREKEQHYLSIIPNKTIVFGEWLGMAKIPYNGVAQQGKIARLWLFDAATIILNEFGNDYDEGNRTWYTLNDFVELAEKLDEKIVPILSFEKYDDNKDYHTLITKVSNIHDDSYMEGVVIKTTDGKKRMKWVGEKFSEAQNVKFKPKQLSFADKIIDTYFTRARFEKFETKMLEDGILQSLDRDNKTRGLYYKNANNVVEDILKEESEQIFSEFKKIMMKSISKKITEFYENDSEEVTNE